MTKETIELKIAALPVYVPVRLIEEKLGMPKTTLQKVLKGGRKLPKKWIKPLEAFFGPEISKPAHPAKIEKEAKPVTEKPVSGGNLTYQQRRLNAKLGIK